MDKQQNVSNATGSTDSASQGSTTGPEHEAPADGNDEKTFSEQNDIEEVIDNIEDAGEDDKQYE